MSLMLYRVQQERKGSYVPLAESGGSGLHIKENFNITAGTYILTRICPGTAVTDLSPVIQEHAPLLFSAQPRFEYGRSHTCQYFLFNSCPL